MTTPTREQVIEWAKEAGLRFDDGWIFFTPKRPSLPEAEIDAFIAAMNAAHTAGRDQGLREAAAKVRAILADCEARDVDDPELEHVAQDIEQLRGCDAVI